MDAGAKEAADAITAQIDALPALWDTLVTAGNVYERASADKLTWEQQTLAAAIGDVDDWNTERKKITAAAAMWDADGWKALRDACVYAASRRDAASFAYDMARQRLSLAHNLFAATFVGTARLSGDPTP